MVFMELRKDISIHKKLSFVNIFFEISENLWNTLRASQVTSPKAASLSHSSLPMGGVSCEGG